MVLASYRFAAVVVLSLTLGFGTAFAQATELKDISFSKRLRLAKAGDDVAALSIAVDYENGSNSARKDLVLAAKWYRQAAASGNTEAQYLLSKLIGKGVPGLPLQPSDGLKLLLSAAEKGYAPAQNELGLRYQLGAGLVANPTEAAKWFEKASDQNMATAQVNLALLYIRGLGTTKDIPRAVGLLQKAAEAGDSWGMHNLGNLYLAGAGVPKDPQKAREFFEKAAAKGNLTSAEQLKQLTPVQ
jgi:uncharacterized protein